MRNILAFVFLVIFTHDGDGFGNQITGNPAKAPSKKKENSNSVPSIITGDANSDSDDDKCNITTIISKSSGKIQSVNYPQPYPINCQWTYIVHVGDGHKVKIDVHSLDLSDEDTLVIMPKPNSDSKAHTEASESTNSSDSFEVDTECCESVIIQFTVGNHSNNHSGFSLSYERNENTDPRQPDKLSICSWYQVYLGGLTVLQLNLMKESFKKSLINTAKEYYEKIKPIKENSSTPDVNLVINYIMPCPISWPWSSNCVQFNFSVTVSDEPTEFSLEHLISFWHMFRSTNELSRLGIREYEVPNIEWLFWFWIALISFLTLLFCLLLLIVIKTKLIYYYFNRLKIPDLTDEMRNNIQYWRNQSSFVYPVFNAENSHRFKFLKEYERTSRPSVNINNYQFTNEMCTQSNGKINDPEELVDDFDSDEDQHIYNSLKFQ